MQSHLKMKIGLLACLAVAWALAATPDTVEAGGGQFIQGAINQYLGGGFGGGYGGYGRSYGNYGGYGYQPNFYGGSPAYGNYGYANRAYGGYGAGYPMFGYNNNYSYGNYGGGYPAYGYGGYGRNFGGGRRFDDD